MSTIYLYDYENLFHFVRSRTRNPVDVVASAINALNEEVGGSVFSAAYGDFDRMPTGAKDTLYFMGIDTRFVPGGYHKDSADLHMCIECVEALHQHKDADRVVLATGDRDFLPLVGHIIRKGLRVTVASFHGAASDALTNAADDYVNLSEYVEEDLNQPKRKALTKALDCLITDYGQYNEVYLTPFLKTLAENFPSHDAKDLLGHLQDAGCITVEKRRGLPTTFSVAVINEDNEKVQEVRSK